MWNSYTIKLRTLINDLKESVDYDIWLWSHVQFEEEEKQLLIWKLEEAFILTYFLIK